MMQHVLPPLPYDYAALEPWIDAPTLRVHHDFHHWKCVERLNRVEQQLATLRIQGNSRPLRRMKRLAAWCAAEDVLHCLFWNVMGPHRGGWPRDDLADQIADDFGSFADFKSRFTAMATGLPSSGWVLLAWQPAGGQQLTIITTDRHHQLGNDVCLLLGLDLWPHAYIRKYQTRRAEYVHNWWNTVNWSRVAQSFAAVARARREVSVTPAQRRDNYESTLAADPAAPRASRSHAGVR